MKQHAKSVQNDMFHFLLFIFLCNISLRIKICDAKIGKNHRNTPQNPIKRDFWNLNLKLLLKVLKVAFYNKSRLFFNLLVSDFNFTGNFT